MAKKEVIKKTEKSKKEVKNKRHFFKDFKAELKKVGKFGYSVQKKKKR